MSNFINFAKNIFRGNTLTRRQERALGVIAIFTIIVAWIIGFQRENAAIEPYLSDALPAADHFKKDSSGVYAGYSNAPSEALIGYVGIGEANGYGGPMKVAVGVDQAGNVLGVAIIKNRETPAWYGKVTQSGFVQSLLGMSYQDDFQLGEGVDGVSGATYTSRAIAESVMKGSRAIAENQLGLPLPPMASPQIQFGVPEISLIALFALGYFGHQSRFKYTKQLRWVGMLSGLFILGFTYNIPLTLASINKFLLGFWPQWQTSIYWYLLIGGILFVFTVDNKNPYCQWFCPFGAAQECMGAIGGAKIYSAGRYRTFFVWLRRGVVWFAIIAALLYRSPGIASYEIFGTLFALIGSWVQFVLLGIVLIVSLFIKRPWCSYLCPIAPIDEFIRMVRLWIKEQWQIINQKLSNEKAN